MNDFHANRDINIKHSSVTVNNPATEIKPIGLLSTSELFEEKKHREQLVQEEQQKRNKHLPKLLVFAGCCIAITWGCQKFADMSHPFFLAVSFLSALASIGSFAFAVNGYGNKTRI